ncbi:MAG: response regulator [Candidatus Pacebacteria bacterium]|nr:response regulator [Candidatus Paceibacterota bacterium]
MSTQPNDKQYTIVLAEDDQLISKACAEGLEEADFRVVTVDSGSDVVDVVKSEKPDILLLDLIMPIKTGFEVLKELREIKEFVELPIIIFSSLSRGDEIQKAVELGATDYIVKPRTALGDMVTKVNKYLPERE